MKSEPNVFSIDDLAAAPEQTTHWDGVRNYKARNYMRDDMKAGDKVFFYHSNIDPSIVGVASVVKSGYPDESSWDRKSKYYDEKSTPDSPRWYMVDIRFEKKFRKPLPLAELRERPELEGMMLLKKGARLSVQPVSPEHWKAINRLAGR